MRDMDRTPRTEAGRALDRLKDSLRYTSWEDKPIIVAIEDEAAASATDEGPPEGTRLVLFSEELALALGADRVEWGEPDEHGWYTPTVFTRPAVPEALDVERLARALWSVTHGTNPAHFDRFVPLNSENRAEHLEHAQRIAREYNAIASTEGTEP